MDRTNRTRDKPAKNKTMLPDDWCFIGGAGLLTAGVFLWLGVAAALISAGCILITAGWLIAKNAGRGGDGA